MPRAAPHVRVAGGRRAGLAAAVKAGQADEMAALFAPDGQELVASSDQRPAGATASLHGGVRRRLAARESDGEPQDLIVGNEAWPFPVPIIKDGNKWRFDTAAGKEECSRAGSGATSSP
jgi:hypothetical protein